MAGVGIAFLLLSLLAAFTAVVPIWPYALFSWQFRSPESMEPSPRRLRVFRAHMAIVAVFFFAVFLFVVAPGSELDRANVALTALLIGFGLLGILLLIVVFSRRHEERRAREAGSEPPNEPSETGYVVLYLSVAFTAVGLLVGAVLFYANVARTAAVDPPLTPEEQAHVDEIIETLDDYFDDLVPTRHIVQPAPPVVAGGPVVPGGALVAAPLEVAVLDPEARTPAMLWEDGEVGGDGAGDGGDAAGGEGVAVDDLLAGADIAVSLPGRRCTVTGVVVVETAEDVAIGLTVEIVSGPTPAPGQHVDCGDPEVPVRTWYPIDLAGPLGEREVVPVRPGG